MMQANEPTCDESACDEPATGDARTGEACGSRAGDVSLALENRRFLHALIARLFAQEPDQALLDVLCSDLAAQHAALLQHEETQAASTALAACASVARDASLADLRAEYTRLFIGPGVLEASPWEAMHVTGKRVLFQPGVLEVRDAYRQAGFLPARYPAVSDDFIGLECDFLSNLAIESLDAFEAGDEAACALRLRQSLDFLEKHLLRWIGLLADALRQASPEGLYANAADFAAACMRRDRDALRLLLGAVPL